MFRMHGYTVAFTSNCMVLYFSTGRQMKSNVMVVGISVLEIN